MRSPIYVEKTYNEQKFIDSNSRIDFMIKLHKHFGLSKAIDKNDYFKKDYFVKYEKSITIMLFDTNLIILVLEYIHRHLLYLPNIENTFTYKTLLKYYHLTNIGLLLHNKLINSINLISSMCYKQNIELLEILLYYLIEPSKRPEINIIKYKESKFKFDDVDDVLVGQNYTNIFGCSTFIRMLREIDTKLYDDNLFYTFLLKYESKLPSISFKPKFTKISKKFLLTNTLMNKDLFSYMLRPIKYQSVTQDEFLICLNSPLVLSEIFSSKSDSCDFNETRSILFISRLNYFLEKYKEITKLIISNPNDYFLALINILFICYNSKRYDLIDKNVFAPFISNFMNTDSDKFWLYICNRAKFYDDNIINKIFIGHRKASECRMLQSYRFSIFMERTIHIAFMNLIMFKRFYKKTDDIDLILYLTKRMRLKHLYFNNYMYEKAHCFLNNSLGYNNHVDKDYKIVIGSEYHYFFWFIGLNPCILPINRYKTKNIHQNLIHYAKKNRTNIEITKYSLLAI